MQITTKGAIVLGKHIRVVIKGDDWSCCLQTSHWRLPTGDFVDLTANKSNWRQRSFAIPGLDSKHFWSKTKTAILHRRRLFEGKLRQAPSCQWFVQRGLVLGTSLIKHINHANISLEINISWRLFHEDLSILHLYDKCVQKFCA